MSIPDKPQTDREITYRVGWKKGKIHVHDASPKESPETVETGPAALATMSVPVPAGTGNKLVSLIWKKAPYPAARIAAGLIYVLPVAVFAAIVWLAARMAEVR